MMDPVPFTIACAIGVGMSAAIGALWRRAILTDRRAEAREKANAEREAAAAARCEREIRALVDRIHFLEERSHNEQQECLRSSMQTIQENARSFGRLVDLEQARQTASGKHPAVKG